MRILYIPSWYPSDKNPLAGSFIRDLAVNLSQEDVHIEVAAFHTSYKDIRKNKYSIKESKNLIEHHFEGWAMPKANKKLQNNWIQNCIDQLIEKVDMNYIDIIHAHDYVSYFLAYEIAREYEIPLTVTLHHSDIMMNLMPTWRKTILTETLPMAEEVVVPSTALKSSLATHFNYSSAIVIPNHIDASQITPKKTLSKTPKNVVTVTSFEKLKNFERTIKIVLENKLKLVAYGTGPEYKKWNAYVKKHKLEETIDLRGNILHEELLKDLVNYDAFISTSNYETFGLSILEALSAGVPVICTNNYGPADFISTKNGIILEENNNDIGRFIQQYQHFNSTEIRDSIITKYDKSIIIANYIKLYHKIYSRTCVA